MSSVELAAIMARLRSRPFDAGAPERDLRAGLDRFATLFGLVEGVSVSACMLGGVGGERHLADEAGPVVLFFHGGGYVTGSPASHRHVASFLARAVGGQVYVVDYRLAPETPFPGALDDALRALRGVTGRHPDADIALVGDSAGGGLVFATTLAARAEGLPAPRALVGLSPWVNLGAESESYDKLAAADPLLSRTVTEYFASRYLGETPRAHPMASPLFADLRGLPPVLIQIGDRECFFGDACRMHQALIAAGVESELTVWKDMFHVWHLWWPMLEEARAALDQAAAFIIRRRTATASAEKGQRS